MNLSFPDLGWLFYVVNRWLELTCLVIITDIGWLFLFIPDIGLLSKDYPCQRLTVGRSPEGDLWQRSKGKPFSVISSLSAFFFMAAQR